MDAITKQLTGVPMFEATQIEKNKLVYQRFIQEIFNEGKIDRMTDLVAPDYLLREGPPGTPSGHEAIKQIVTIFRSAFPDLKITIEHLIGEGDTLAARSVTQGTHLGSFFGVKATGKSIRMPGLTMVRIVNGKLQESWVRNDMQGLIHQLNPS